VKYFTTPQFWELYRKLPANIQRQADRNYALLKIDQHHPSLHFKRIGDLWSVRVGIHYRALGFEHDEGIVWFWIGSHAEYDKLMP
jgi:hypothetical protein